MNKDCEKYAMLGSINEWVYKNVSAVDFSRFHIFFVMKINKKKKIKKNTDLS